MAYVFAEFEHLEWQGQQLAWADGSTNGLYIRKDTRVYADSRDERSRSDGECVGAFWLKNPGSAKPSHLEDWGPCAADDGDQTLSLVRKLLQRIRKSRHFESAVDPYIQILNVIYATTPNVKLLKRLLCQQRGALNCEDVEAHDYAVTRVLDYREPGRSSPFVVLGWGGLLQELGQSAYGQRVKSVSQFTREAVSRLIDDSDTLVVRAQQKISTAPTEFFRVSDTVELSHKTRHPLLAKEYNDRLLAFLDTHLR